MSAGSARSTPSTCPVAPTRCAAGSADAPVPQHASRTRSPGRRPTRATVRRRTGPKTTTRVVEVLGGSRVGGCRPGLDVGAGWVGFTVPHEPHHASRAHPTSALHPSVPRSLITYRTTHRNMLPLSPPLRRPRRDAGRCQRMTSRRRPRRSARAALAIATAAITLSAVALAGSAGAAPGDPASGTYLVQLAGAPIAAYTGGVSGIAATKPAPGAKLDPDDLELPAYREYLRAKRAEVLGKAKIDKKKTGGRVRHRAQRRRGEAHRRRGRQAARHARRRPASGRTRSSSSTRSAPRGSWASTAPAARGTQQFGDVSAPARARSSA